MERTLLPILNRLLAEVSDQDLLTRYVHRQDQDAFTQLVTRYDRLVWGQCRNLLANDADADDAFQATFLTLARSVKTLKAGSPLGPWLHGVTYRICMNARRAIGRRAKREKASARSDSHQPVADSSWETAFVTVAEEVQELPEAQRVAFVLRYLEGRSVADAAASLDLKLGTFTARLSRAKRALLERMARRGLGAGILPLRGTTGSAAVASAELVERTLALLPSGPAIPGSVQALTYGVTSMSIIQLKLVEAAVIAVTVTIIPGADSGQSVSVAAAAAPVPKGPESTLVTPDARKAIDTGLAYLAKNQAKDGSWVTTDYRGSLAITALAGRAFLAAGHQPGRGPNGERLTKAIGYVLQAESGGLLAKGKSAPMYEHGFAVHFLAEAHRVVGDKDLKERMKATLTRAVRVIAEGQNQAGGWRYQTAPRDADLSVTCCQLQALAAAKRAGIEVPQATIDNGIKYVLSCRDSDRYGRFRYVPSAPSIAAAEFAHTSAAISALNAVGFKDEKELLENGTEFIRSFKPVASDLLFYDGRYNATPIMKESGGKGWEAWYSSVRDALIEGRNKDGVWDEAMSSSLFNTSLALIVLQSAR